MNDASKLCFVNVGPEGTFNASGRVQTSPDDVDAILAHVEADRPPRIVLHFHGGLVSEGQGMSIAASMQPVYEQAGCHPVTFVWETGFIETVKRNLGTISATQIFQRIVEVVVRQISKTLGGIGGRGPGQPLTHQEVKTELTSAEPFLRLDDGARAAAERLGEGEFSGLRANIAAGIEEDLAANPDLRNGLTQTDGRLGQPRGIVATAVITAMARITFRVIARYRERHDHGFYPTVVEEILRELYLADGGQWTWGKMKQAAEQMWLPNDGLEGDCRHAGRYFLEGLLALRERHPELEVDLVGHSAGSIAICHLLRTAGARLPVRNVVFLAPACTSHLFRSVIVEPPHYFSRFRMFTMRDDYECRDHLVPGVYTRSLLYFISGVLERDGDGRDAPDLPLAGLQRFQSGMKPYDTGELIQMRNYLLASGEDHLVLSNTTTTAPQSLPGLLSTAEHHGDFDNDTVTRDSLIAILKSREADDLGAKS